MLYQPQASPAYGLHREPRQSANQLGEHQDLWGPRAGNDNSAGVAQASVTGTPEILMLPTFVS
jgi:hypothetical protein